MLVQTIFWSQSGGGQSKERVGRWWMISKEKLVFCWNWNGLIHCFQKRFFFHPGGVHNLFLYHGIERIKLKGYYANKVPPWNLSGAVSSTFSKWEIRDQLTQSIFHFQGKVSSWIIVKSFPFDTPVKLRSECLKKWTKADFRNPKLIISTHFQRETSTTEWSLNWCTKNPITDFWNRP